MEAQQVAETYLRALLCGDRETALGLSPTRPENKFGPCPLAQMPQLGSARVDAHRAAVTFVGFRPPPFDRLRAGSAGRALDPQAPGDGAVLLTRLDQVRGNPWRVRQVAFFTKAPLGTRVPSRSITREDIAQEPLAQAAARRYIAAWLKGDYRTMQNLAFDWLARLHRSSHGLRIRSIELSSEAAPGGEARINFTARIILYRALPRRVQGTVFAMREDGEWKIRASELTL